MKMTEQEKQAAKRTEKYVGLLIKDTDALRDRLCLLYDDLSNDPEKKALSDAFGAYVSLRTRLDCLYAMISCDAEINR